MKPLRRCLELKCTGLENEALILMEMIIKKRRKKEGGEEPTSSLFPLHSFSQGPRSHSHLPPPAFALVTPNSWTKEATTSPLSLPRVPLNRAGNGCTADRRRTDHFPRQIGS